MGPKLRADTIGKVVMHHQASKVNPEDRMVLTCVRDLEYLHSQSSTLCVSNAM
jgi:hypothetical protein